MKMCGIFCILSECEHNTIKESTTEFEKYEKSILRRGPNSFHTTSYKTEFYNIFFASSVLWLQGKNQTIQPLENNKSIFLYNGDVFGGSISDNLRKDIGDTILFLNELESFSYIAQTLSKIQGPYAFIYLNKESSKIYFGRDVYGRRSLLIGIKSGIIILTSVAKRSKTCNFIELPSIGTYCFDLKSRTIELYPWPHKNTFFYDKFNELKSFLNKDILINNNQIEINERNYNYIPPSESDLKLFNDIKSITIENAFNVLLSDTEWLNKVIQLRNLLENSVRERVLTQIQFCQDCIENNLTCNHSLVGILFSGGVDCSVLTILANKFIDEKRPIDLINVAFNKVKDFTTPDRLSSLEALKELKTLCPHRQWNFVQVNVTQEELNFERSNHIADLIYPLNTILDDSLGCALWFASRAKINNYISPCKVLLVGMGADELFGGYKKHRVALKNKGWQGIHQVLDEDWQNLPYRNLGRDDRVVSDNGKQLRTPYLDENVVTFLRKLNSWEKTCPLDDIPQGFGDKILLRSLAYLLGMKNIATFKKRALQFGSRIANPKEKAHEICSQLIT